MFNISGFKLRAVSIESGHVGKHDVPADDICRDVRYITKSLSLIQLQLR